MQILDEAREWIAEQGSSRLRKIVEQDMLEEALPAYRVERLARERPGWEFSHQHQRITPNRMPLEGDLDMLALVRQEVSGSIDLEWMVESHRHDGCGPCRKRWEFRGAVLTDMWLGKEILKKLGNECEEG